MPEGGGDKPAVDASQVEQPGDIPAGPGAVDMAEGEADQTAVDPPPLEQPGDSQSGNSLVDEGVFDPERASFARDKERQDLVLQIWKSDKAIERGLKQAASEVVLWLLPLLSLAAVAVLVAVGVGKLVIPEWVASVFFGAVFSAVGGLATIVFHYVFRQNDALYVSMLVPPQAKVSRRRGEGRKKKRRPSAPPASP